MRRRDVMRSCSFICAVSSLDAELGCLGLVVWRENSTCERSATRRLALRMSRSLLPALSGVLGCTFGNVITSLFFF